MNNYKVPDNFTVEMNQEMIGMGVRHEGRQCPIHNALESLDFLYDVLVDHAWVEFFVNGEELFISASKRFETVMANYDDGGEFPLGVVIVDMVSKTIDFEASSDQGRNA